MTLPALLFGFLIASLYGAVFHLWRGGSLGRLLLYQFLSQLGFWIGHALGKRWGWNFFSLGPLWLGTATLGAIAWLALGHWLSLVDHKEAT
jgi:hypothetical protein